MLYKVTKNNREKLLFKILRQKMRRKIKTWEGEKGGRRYYQSAFTS